MTIIELTNRIHDKLASRDHSLIELKATVDLLDHLDEGQLLRWTITASEGGTLQKHHPILTVITDQAFEVVEVDTLDAIDEARWAAIHMAIGAAPLRAVAEIPF